MVETDDEVRPEEAGTEVEAEVEVPEVTSETGPRRRRVGPYWVIGLLVVMVAGLIVALVMTLGQLSDQNNLNGDRASALAAARTDATDVSSYSYARLHQDFARVEDEATPSFRRSFIQSSDGLSKVLAQYKATATGKVLNAAVVSVTSTKAVVILFVNQTVTNTAQSGGPTTDNSRIQVTLVRSGGRWLLQDLKLL